MRLLGITCDGNGVEVAAGILHHDAGVPGGVDFEAFVSLRREGPASVSDCALELVDEVLANLARSLPPGTGPGADFLDGLVFNAGPGGFTAVRSACALAQGLALGWGKPLAALSSFEAWAEPLLLTVAPEAPDRAPQQALVLLDARMGELYCALLQVSARDANAEPLPGVQLHCLAQAVMPPAAIDDWLQAQGSAADCRRWLLGDFAPPWPELLCSLEMQGWTPRLESRMEGRSLLRQAFRRGRALFRPAAEAGPLYVRNKVALNSMEQQQLRDGNARDSQARDVKAADLRARDQTGPAPAVARD